ncbi:MAG: glycosyltransferase family 4 protein [Hyphomicrobiales bacterium]|nr:glycosyltransferase family 4 protein [Hyphomicrobiales bacterium]
MSESSVYDGQSGQHPANGIQNSSRKLKLLYIHDAPVPSLAANGVQVAKMCQAFQAAGADTTLIVPRDGNAGADRYDLIAEAYGLKRHLRFAAKALPVMRVPGRTLWYGASAVLSAGLGPHGMVYTRSISVGAAAAALGRPFVLELHMPVSAYRPVVARRLRRLARGRALRLLVVISDRLRRDYERNMPEVASRILVAHDGADAVRGDVATLPLRGDFKVGYVGQLYPGKGMEILAALAPRCPWATFHIVGGNPPDVEHWTATLRSASNVAFHGHVPHAATPSYLAAMDVVLAPYLRVVKGVGGGEQNLAEWMSPLKIFEYMAHGKAIVASDLAVLGEVLRDEENAVLCAPEAPADWAAALDRLRRDADLLNRLGETARWEFEARYTWDRRAKLILDAIQEHTHVAAHQRGEANDSERCDSDNGE